MVSKGWTPPGSPSGCDGASSIENLRRIKSDAFFTNFRRINLNANTGDLLMAASQEPIARHQAQRIKTDG
jgi:hypothetical protein